MADGLPTRAPRHPRGHPLEVAHALLGDLYEAYFDKFSGSERDAIGIVRQALAEISEGQR